MVGGDNDLANYFKDTKLKKIFEYQKTKSSKLQRKLASRSKLCKNEMFQKLNFTTKNICLEF